MVFLFTFITNTTYGETITTVTSIGNYEFIEPCGLAVGNHDNIYISDSEASTSSRTVSMPIPISPELKINAENSPNVTVRTAYSYLFTSTGGIGEKSYALTSKFNYKIF